MGVEIIFENVCVPCKILGELMDDISLRICLDETARGGTSSGFDLLMIG